MLTTLKGIGCAAAPRRELEMMSGIGRRAGSGNGRRGLRCMAAGTLGGALVLASLVVGAGTAGAVPVTLTCGSVVTSNTTLNATLTCATYHGEFTIEVDGSGVTLNLGGHKVVSGSDYGVLVDDSTTATVTNGRVEGAEYDVWAEETSGFTATRLTATDSFVGIAVVDSIDALITENTANDSVYGYGEAEASTATVSENTLNDDETGFIGTFETDNTAVKSNSMSNDYEDGLFMEVDSSGDVVTGNHAVHDGEYGFYSLSTVSGSGNIDIADPDRCYNVSCVIP